MTVIAWDGKTLAADKRASGGATHTTVTKVRRIFGMLVGGSGTGSEVRRVIAWIEAGAEPAKWPNPINDASEVVCVWRAAGRPVLGVYFNSAYPMICEDKFYALGTGSGVALAAMHLGRTAKEAVELACVLCSDCGNGIDTLEFEP